MLALVSDTVVWIHLTVQTCETWGTEAAVKRELLPWNQLAGTPIEAAPGGTLSWLELTACTLPPSRAETLEGPQGIMTGGALGAEAWVPVTLIDIMFAGMALEARWAAALDLGVRGQAHPSIDAGVGRAEVLMLALLTCPPWQAGAPGAS